MDDVPYHHHPHHKVEDRGLVGDIAMGILVGKIQEMLGITTTPKPRPIIGIFIIFFNTSSTYLYSSPTSQQPNRWHCRPPGCHNYNSRPTHRRREVAFPTKWEQKMGTLGTRFISDLVFSKPCSLCSSLPPTPPPQRRRRQPPSVVVFLEVKVPLNIFLEVKVPLNIFLEVSAFEHLLGGKCL